MYYFNLCLELCCDIFPWVPDLDCTHLHVWLVYDWIGDVTYLKLYFYSSHTMSFSWSVLYDMSLWSFCFYFVSSILAGHTSLIVPKLCYDLLELLSMLHLNLFQLWNCASASLIYFWAWCDLVFLKKLSHSSLSFIW